MDTPFDTTRWRPTRCRKPGDQPIAPHQLKMLSSLLAEQTKDISRHPYDPEHWLARSKTLRQLRYPELALGDAHKATLLVRQCLRQLWDDTRGRWRLGKGRGFWMLDEEEHADGEETAALRLKLLALEEKARLAEERCLCASLVEGKGRFVPRPYPWLGKGREERSDDLVLEMNAELQDCAERSLCESSPVDLRRYAFGDSGSKSRDVLGIFATRDIARDSTVLVDRTRIWGCNGPGSSGDLENLHGGSGCGDPIHPNLPEEGCTLDLRWIRDESGRDASSVLLKCRLLLAAIQDGVANPLEHPLVARLTPTYAASSRTFWRHADIDIPLRALQQFGVDIFARPEWETWVLFTIFARVENNSCDDVVSESLMPLFSLFNHACEPNAGWTRHPGGAESRGSNQTDEEEDDDFGWPGQQRSARDVDHATIIVTALTDVKAGEQLFVEYNWTVHDCDVWERREKLKKWLAEGCMCARCVREEKEAGPAKRVSSGSEGSGSWDDESERPSLPEDGYRGDDGE